MRIPESEWKWYGYPIHFIMADRCIFRMSTVIGKIAISSVGDCEITKGNLEEEIGFNRKYETMVFPLLDISEPCGCPQADVSRELYMIGSNDYINARENHMKVCEMVANGEIKEENLATKKVTDD